MTQILVGGRTRKEVLDAYALKLKEQSIDSPGTDSGPAIAGDLSRIMFTEESTDDRLALDNVVWCNQQLIKGYSTVMQSAREQAYARITGLSKGDHFNLTRTVLVYFKEGESHNIAVCDSPVATCNTLLYQALINPNNDPYKHIIKRDNVVVGSMLSISNREGRIVEHPNPILFDNFYSPNIFTKSGKITREGKKVMPLLEAIFQDQTSNYLSWIQANPSPHGKVHINLLNIGQENLQDLSETVVAVPVALNHHQPIDACEPEGGGYFAGRFTRGVGWKPNDGDAR